MTFSDRDYDCKRHAINIAKTAANNQEVPVGAVLVLDDINIGEGYNTPIIKHDPSAHAEMVALRAGALKCENYRLPNSTLYVTLEPCMMCVGAIVHARVGRLVYGAADPRTGAAVSMLRGFELPFLNHKVECVGGLMEQECGELLKGFFRDRR